MGGAHARGETQRPPVRDVAFNLDPLGGALLTGMMHSADISDAAAFAVRMRDDPPGATRCASMRVRVHEAGGTAAQELRRPHCLAASPICARSPKRVCPSMKRRGRCCSPSRLGQTFDRSGQSCVRYAWRGRACWRQRQALARSALRPHSCHHLKPDDDALRCVWKYFARHHSRDRRRHRRGGRNHHLALHPRARSADTVCSGLALQHATRPAGRSASGSRRRSGGRLLVRGEHDPGSGGGGWAKMQQIEAAGGIVAALQTRDARA